MRAALLALLVTAEVAAASPRVLNRLGDYWRLDRRNRLSAGTSAAPDVSLFRLLSSTSTIPGGECSGQTVTGTRGESINFTRSSAANCQKADGTWVAVSTDQPRASNLMGQPGLLMEQTATNLALYSRDLSNATWTTSAMTCTKNATGIDGVSSSASTCTASNFIGSVTQAITTSGARVTSVFVKRVTGTSTLEMTRNNGGSWTALNSSNCFNATTYVAQNINSANWSRCWVLSNVTNPVIGFRANADGDSFVIDAVQDEGTTFTDVPTSPIFTTSTTVARAGDVAYVNNPSDFSNTTGCMAAKIFKTSAGYAGANPRILETGGGRVVATGSAVYASDNTNTAIDYRTTFGTLLDVVTRWTTSTNQLAIVVNTGTPATASYDGSMLGTTVRFGIDSSGTQALNGWLANIRLGAATGDCAQ